MQEIYEAQGLTKWIEIDLSRFRRNIELLRARLSPSTQLMAVLKGNGYGLGLVRLAEVAVASGASWIGVAGLHEADTLRKAGIGAKTLNLTSIHPAEASEVIRLRVSQAVYTRDVLLSLSREASDKGVTVCVHVKIDTGLGRVGVLWHQAADFLKEVANCSGIFCEGIFSTLAEVEDTEFAKAQVDRLKQVARGAQDIFKHRPILHIRSSFGIPIPESELEMVRYGMALLGCEGPEDLLPIASMRARVDLVKPVRRGDGIGYGHRYVYDRDGYVATLPVGWVDGIPRGLTNRGEVLIKGRRCKVVGIVSMNHTMVDVSDICGEVKRGDIATLIGTDGRDRISVQEVAHRAGTSAHELLVRLGRDLPRLYK